MAENSGQVADEGGDGDSGVDYAVEAASMGWVDKDQFRGDPETWVDAKDFVERGRHIMPILQKNNERLTQTIRELSGRLSGAEEATRAANAAINALQESHDEDVAAQVEAARGKLKAEIAQASRDGDHEALADATDSLTKLNAADVDAGDKANKRRAGDRATQNNGSGQVRELHPEVKAWFADNPDFVADKRRLALGDAIAIELREKGDARIGKSFMDAVAQEVEKTLGGSFQGGASRVSGGNGGTGRSTGGGMAGKTYADLPSEAKQVCDRMAQRLVGPDRKHKDIASWRKSYTNQYFEEQA